MSRVKNIITNPRLDYFESPNVQLVNKIPTGLRAHLPLNTLDVQPIQFSIIGNGRESINFDQHYLYVRLRIVNAAGVPLAPEYNGHCALINNCIHSLFRHVTVQVNGITVTPSSDYYPLHSYLTSLLSASKENVNTLKLQGWHRDTGNVGVMGALNLGFTARAALFNQGTVQEFMAPLDVDMFKVKKNFPPNTRIDIKLYRSADTFVCQHDDHQEAGNGPGAIKVDLQACELYLRHELHMESVLNAMERTALHGHNFKLPYQIMTIKSDIIQAAQTSFTRDNIALGQSPVAALIGFIPADAFNGTYGSTPFNFVAGNNILSAYMEVNGRKLAFDNPLNLDLANNRYKQAYHSLLLFAGQHKWFNSGLDFSPEEFITGNFLMGCSNIRDLDSAGNAIEPPEEGATKVHCTWRNGGPGQLTIPILIFIFETVTEITSTRQVIHTFNQ